jgi:hypothetical protein
MSCLHYGGQVNLRLHDLAQPRFYPAQNVAAADRFGVPMFAIEPELFVSDQLNYHVLASRTFKGAPVVIWKLGFRFD